MKIEERAKEYASKQVIQSYSYCGYLHGAIDQDHISRADERKKVIDKACEWMKGLAFIEGTDFLLLDQNPMRPEIQLDVDAMIEQFKQAMEE